MWAGAGGSLTEGRERGGQRNYGRVGAGTVGRAGGGGTADGRGYRGSLRRLSSPTGGTSAAGRDRLPEWTSFRRELGSESHRTATIPPPPTLLPSHFTVGGSCRWQGSFQRISERHPATGIL